MIILYKKVFSLGEWIKSNTSGSKSVVELGAGFFNNLSFCEDAEQKIGIELMQCYIDNAKYNDCIKILGDAINYKRLLPVNCRYDVALIVDFLEHLTMSEGKSLIENLKKDFSKILLMIPCGLYDQSEDVTGFEAHEAQTHKSFWYEDDIISLGFSEVIFDREFHKGNPLAKHDTSCGFCVWEK